MKQLIHNGTIYTMEKEHETVEAVLIENGEIIATGKTATLQPEADTKLDLKGATMYPGFVDSHLHIMHIGNKLAMLDLSYATSAEEMLTLIKKTAQKLPEDAWLFADGWNENNFPDQRIPTVEELDNIHKGPIHMTRICHHVSLNNSSALAFGRITKDTPSPSGGKIGKNEDGTLNGLLYEQASAFITDRLPKEGDSYQQSLIDMMDNAINELLAVGITGGHTEDMHYFGAYTYPLKAFHETIGKKRHFRAHLLRHHEVFEAMISDGATYDDGFVEPGAMKIFADGSFGGLTAALSAPYTDDPNNKGLLIHTDEEMEELVKIARKHHEAVAIHMIGDAALEQAIKVIEKHPAPDNKRDRFIHTSLVRDDLIERMKHLPVVIDAQPLFVSSDFPWLTERLGEDRVKLAYPWKTLLDSGIKCAASTDAPIEHINPLETIYAAIMRKKPLEANSNFPEQNVSRFEAIQMYTLGSAYAANQENYRGLIKTGYDADFTIIDQDLFSGNPEDILQAKAVKTIVNGNIVYEA